MDKGKYIRVLQRNKEKIFSSPRVLYDPNLDALYDPYSTTDRSFFGNPGLLEKQTTLFKEFSKTSAIKRTSKRPRQNEIRFLRRY